MVLPKTLLYQRPEPIKVKKNPLHLWWLGPVESGKQIVIHQLNAALGWPASEFDMAELLFRRFRGTASEIAQAYGPNALPRLGTAIIEKLSEQPEDTMVPVGDELLCPEAIKIMTRTGVAVWFHCKPEEGGKMEEWSNHGEEEILQRIIHIQTGGRAIEQIVEDILEHPLMQRFQS